jgi:hypothetical protein
MLEKFINVKQFKNQPQYNAVGGSLHKNKSSHKSKSHKSKSHKSKSHKSKTHKKNKYNNYTIHNASRKYNKRNLQNYQANITLSNRHFKHGGRVFSHSGHHKHTRKTQSRTSYKSQSEAGINNEDFLDLGLDLALDLGLSLNGGNASDTEHKRRFKYMDLFTLKDFQSRNKSIKLSKSGTADGIIERVIAALYYGYSTNIACYTGKDKDYKVKFSSIKGTITGGMSKNSFDFKYPDSNPDFIIYNKFTVQQEFGKLEPKGNLTLITILETKHLAYFFDLPDIMKQVMTEIK